MPPTFLVDHSIRTIASQGAMTLGELSRHWRVSGDVATQIIEPLKLANLVESDTSRPNIETGQRWRLTATGQARLESARARTWYAGPLPVSALEFASSFAEGNRAALDAEALCRVLQPFGFDTPTIDELGQAIAGGAPLLLGGCANDEQAAIAQAIGTAFQGSMKLPHAIFAAGAVIRVVDPRVHHRVGGALTPSVDEGALRAREDNTPWLQVRPPSIILTGGLLGSDVVPAFDDDARFYLAPAPLSAAGGLLAVCNGAHSDPDALDRLARLWLVPSAAGVGVLLLRTGERVDAPWGAAVIIFASPGDVSQAFASAVPYHVDAAPLGDQALRSFLAHRLPEDGIFTGPVIDGIAGLLERIDLARRPTAAAFARYVRDRWAYEGAVFRLDDAVMNAALRFAASHLAPDGAERRAA